MLDLLSGISRTCDGLQRRELLRLGALSGLGISLPQLLAQRARAEGSAKDVNCILIWTLGGTSHHDTFDPKPLAPVSVKGPFETIQTSVPGVHFTEVAPRMARELNRFSVMRSLNPQNGSHGTADQIMMSGHNWNPAIVYPTFGSVVSWMHGFKSALPPFVQLGDAVSKNFGGGTSGFLPVQHGPFEILADPGSPQFSVRDITPPQGISFERVDRRKAMLQSIDSLQKKADLQPRQFDALDEHFKAALSMITAPETKRAFALEQEDPRLRDRYGRTRFGQSLLLSRRLVQSGVRFVTVSDNGWDTHADNFNSLKNHRMPAVDQALPELLSDLEEQGMLDSTMVIWLTDFGRTPKINSASGRDHWATAGFAIAAGAGIPGGTVIGATDEEGGAPIRDEYLSADIGATVYHKLGIPLDQLAPTPDGRHLLLNEGRLVKQWV